MSDLEDPIATRVGCLFMVVIVAMLVAGVVVGYQALR